MSKLKLMKYYVYAYLDTTKEGNYKYSTSMGDFMFDYEPIYIGKGTGGRMKGHEIESHNPRLKKLIETGTYDNLIVSDSLPSHFAYKLESELIYQIGRTDLQTGPLVNESGGLKLVESAKHAEIGPLHLEYNKVLHVIRVLNESKTIKDASSTLGMSCRTIYRYLKSYQIKKDKSTSLYHQV